MDFHLYFLYLCVGICNCCVCMYLHAYSTLCITIVTYSMCHPDKHKHTAIRIVLYTVSKLTRYTKFNINDFLFVQLQTEPSKESMFYFINVYYKLHTSDSSVDSYKTPHRLVFIPIYRETP